MAGLDKGACWVVVSKVCMSLCSLAMVQGPSIVGTAVCQQMRSHAT